MNFLLVHDESFDFDGICYSQIPAKCNNIFIKGYNSLFYLFREVFFCLNKLRMGNIKDLFYRMSML